MKRFILAIVISLSASAQCWAAFTEFYCNPATGSNMNGGSEEATSPSYSATNGGWNSGTGVFTPTSGDPSASVTVGEYAHVFTDGSTTPTFIGRVTAVDSTTVTVSTTLKSGTAPTTAGSGISINVGGVWKGPNGASGFPFNLLQGTMKNDDSSAPRINFKNNATYDITATMTGSTDTGLIVYQGYTTTVGDGGMAKIDGGASGTRYILLSVSAHTGKQFHDIWFTRNGASSTQQYLVNSHSSNTFFGCRYSHSSGGGAAAGRHIGCESDNNGGGAGFNLPNTIKRCIIHDNAGGGVVLLGAIPQNCIAFNNGTYGFYVDVNTAMLCGLDNCDAYNNGTVGVLINKGSGSSGASIVLENCNIVNNTTYGIGIQGAGTSVLLNLLKVGFGAGTMANASGDIQSGDITRGIDTSFSYANDVTPWVDPDTGNFSVSLAAAIDAGFADFLQGDTTYSGTVSYPDIGATQHEVDGGGGGGGTDQVTIVPFYGDDIPEDDGSKVFAFTTNFNGVPTALTGGALQFYVNGGSVQTSGVTLGTIATGVYKVTVDSASANFNGGGDVLVTLSAGTVGGVDVTNAKVGDVSVGRNATAPDGFAGLDIDGSGAVIIQDGTDPGQIATTSGAIDAVTTTGTVTNGVNVTQFGGTNGTFSSGIPAVNSTQWGGTAVATAVVRADMRKILGTDLNDSGSDSNFTDNLASNFSILFGNSLNNGLGPAGVSYISDIRTRTNRIPNIAAGSNGGLLIAGSNAATTFATLTSTGAFTVNGSTTLAANVTQFGGSAGTFSGGLPAVNTTQWGRTATASASVLADIRKFDGLDTIDSLSPSEVMAVVLSVSAGKISGSAANEPTIRSVDDTVDRVTSEVNQYGDRTSITLDLSGIGD